MNYILDGQQRLATLFGCLRISADFSNEKEEDSCWWIYFNLKSLEFTHKHGKPEPWLLPLRVILNTLDFLKWSRSIFESNPKEAEKWIEEAEYLSKKLKSYKVAVIRIHGGELAQAVEIFSRLNSKGQSMTPDQMVSALTYTDGQKNHTLSDCIDDILEKLDDYQFGNISRMTVFRAIVSASGREIHRSDWESLAKKLLEGDLNNEVEKASKALIHATKFLCHELNVPGDKFLPYRNQLLILSEFFQHCSEPNKKQAETLQQWFWRTSLSDRLTSANTTDINKMLKEMATLAGNSNAELQVISSKHPMRPFPNSYSLRNARVRALVIFMYSFEPLDLETGNPISSNLIQSGNQGLPYVFSGIPNKGGSNPANRLFLTKIPGQAVKKRLLSIPEKFRKQVLDSHLISQEAFKALEDDQSEEFIKIRANEMERKEIEFMKKFGGITKS